MFFYRFLYVFIWPLFRLLFHPKVRGRENIPKSGAIIFAGNHKSNLDCVLLATCLWRQVHFMAKDELFRGAAGGFFRALGTIPVNRRIRDASALSEAQKVLDAGGIIGIFPEGSFNRTKETVMPFKPGAARMAATYQVYLADYDYLADIQGLFEGSGIQEIEFYPAIETAERDAASIGHELENTVREGLENGKR